MTQENQPINQLPLNGLIIQNLKAICDGREFHYNYEIPKGSFIGITGPSGVGKSMLLQLIAGLRAIQSGSLLFDKHSFTHLPPQRRPVSLLFQQDNLFEHLTIRQNIALGLTLKFWKTKEEHQRIDEMLALLHLEKMADKKATEVSGGEAQRAALGRVLLRQRSILLLDEPFSSLDPLLRMELLNLVKTLHEENHLTTLIVSHQPDEIKFFVDDLIELKKPPLTDC